MRFDASFLASLTRMVNEEPAQTHDPALITLLNTLGFEKGKQVRASAKAQASLKPALAQADTQLQQAFAGDLQAFWSGNVPVQQFWVLSVNDRATRSFIRKSPRVALASP